MAATKKARSTKAPNDFTGREMEENAALAAEQEQAAQEQLTMARQQQVEEIDTVVDYTTEIIGEDDAVEMRVGWPLKNVTIGQGNVYTFEPGRKYRVPRHVYDHLDEKGYVYH